MAKEKEKNLLFSVTRDDCDWGTFTVGGNGGSGKDTSNTGVRCKHRASGAVGTSRDTRSQLTNRRLAFRRMAETETFRKWVHAEAARLGPEKPLSIDEIVDGLMDESNLKVEYF